jgi:hypothetical protein
VKKTKKFKEINKRSFKWQKEPREWIIRKSEKTQLNEPFTRKKNILAKNYGNF